MTRGAGMASQFSGSNLAGVIALATAAATLPQPAFGQSADQLGAQAEAQYAALSAEAETRAGDPAFDYRLGVAAADSGHYGEAIIALQRVLAIQPGFAQARAELARAYALAGDIDTARAQFATVVDDPSLPDPVRQRFTGFVRSLDSRIKGGGTSISGFAEAGAGHDSNINAATDLTAITIPLFAGLGPGTLGAGARATGDEFADVSAGASVVRAIGRQDRVFASALGDWRDNFGGSAFDQQSVTGTAGVAHTFANKDVVSVSGQVQGYWLGHDPYRTAYGAIVQFTRPLPGGRALSISAQYNRFDYSRDPLRDADRYALGIGYATRGVSANLIAGHEETRMQAGDANSNSFAGASAGAEVPVGPRVAVVVGAAFDLRRYDAQDVLFLTKRRDERIDLSAAVKVAVLPHLFLQPKATWSRNWSNIALYDHKRWTASAGLRFEF